MDSARADALERAQSYVSDTASRFFWYEFTPYEIGCDEIGGISHTRVFRFPFMHSRPLPAWIPSWAFGREFFNGESLERRVRGLCASVERWNATHTEPWSTEA